jgi:geranylgeranyl diphosphate synthase type II
MAPIAHAGYAAGTKPQSVVLATPDSLLALVHQLLAELGRRAPAILAAAAEELGDTRLCLLELGGGTLFLRANGLAVVAVERMPRPHVRVEISEAAVAELLSLDQSLAKPPTFASINVQGGPGRIFRVWRAFQGISLRAAGLRSVQHLWLRFRAAARMPATVTPAAATLPAPPASVPPSSTLVPRHQVLWDGHRGTPWWHLAQPKDADLLERMASYWEVVHRKVLACIPDREPRATLYDLMREYPQRGGKLLRPILLLTSCRALGGTTELALDIAAAIELFQNGFLVHDDVEDGSDLRRGQPCLHRRHGIALAINAGDGMNLLALQAILSGVEHLGLIRSLAVMNEVLGMCRETVEGQAIELGWIFHHQFPRDEAAYLDMVLKKSAWYTTIGPCRLGALAAGRNTESELTALYDVWSLVGLAFQIQDDILNLVDERSKAGKEALGDLLEGKRTLITTHMLRKVSARQRGQLQRWLAKPRGEKNHAEAERVLDRLHATGSIRFARKKAATLAARAARLFEQRLQFMPENEDKATLRQVVHYVAIRDV